MFVSFLYPYPLRGRRASFLWVAYKQVGDLGPENVAFLSSEDYFEDPEAYRLDGRFECHAPVNPELGFRVPTHAELQAFPRAGAPEAIYRRLKSELVSDARVWLHLIRHEDPQLTEWVCETATRLCSGGRPEALLTWCNYASLSAAGRQLGVPVLHCELGPLRDPWYVPLGYLDFCGVNANTEAERRARACPPLPSRVADRDSLFRFFSRCERSDLSEGPRAKLGVALQVEDDSNVLAYGRGFDTTLVLQYALERFAPEELLVRAHPGSWSVPRPGLPVDTSTTSAEFVARCERVLTLSSSVAVEAMLLGKPVTLLGESPARHLANPTLDTATVADLQALEFLLSNYFVPYHLLFQPEYLRWRMGNPGEAAIRERHWAELAAARERLTGGGEGL